MFSFNRPLYFSLLIFMIAATAQSQDPRRAYFLTYDELTARLKELAAQAPKGLATIETIGKSRQGRNLWLLTLAGNRNETPLDRRPAFLATANQHSVELAGHLAALRLIERLISGYGSDERIRRILNEQVVYVVPRVSIDGAEHVLMTNHNVRSRFVDVRERNVPLSAGPER